MNCCDKSEWGASTKKKAASLSVAADSSALSSGGHLRRPTIAPARENAYLLPIHLIRGFVSSNFFAFFKGGFFAIVLPPLQRQLNPQPILCKSSSNVDDKMRGF
jgi:hypothetical protein